MGEKVCKSWKGTSSVEDNLRWGNLPLRADATRLACRQHEPAVRPLPLHDAEH